MSDYDDMMADYDWYQNTGENREFFEDDEPEYDGDYDEDDSNYNHTNYVHHHNNQRANRPQENNSPVPYIICSVICLAFLLYACVK